MLLSQIWGYRDSIQTSGQRSSRSLGRICGPIKLALRGADEAPDLCSEAGVSRDS